MPKARWDELIRLGLATMFEHVVDKGAAGSLVSFCGEGVRKIGPTQFEMRKTDFVPQRDLSVLILEKMGQ